MANDIKTGRCLCGNIQFEVQGTPIWIVHCHCQSCRRNTGSAVATFVGFQQEQVIYTQGERTFYESSPGVKRGFCAQCGTPLSYEGKYCPGEIHLYLSTLDKPEAFVPQRHVFFEEHIPWLDLHDDLPRFNTFGAGKKPDSYGPKNPSSTKE